MRRIFILILTGITFVFLSVANNASASGYFHVVSRSHQKGVASFVSAPSLHPPEISQKLPPGEGDLFIAPFPNFGSREPFVGSLGPEIIAPNKQLVWENPLPGDDVAIDFHASTYEDKPVLVWWQGHITKQGRGNGVWEIANQHYQVIATVTAPKGWRTDLHDFRITPQGDAYFFGSKKTTANLSCCGGKVSSAVVDNAVFEVDLTTDKVIWQWDALQHIPLRESHAAITTKTPWDAYHFNSIDPLPSGTILLSARNTWSLYWVNQASGNITDTVGGKKTSFHLGKKVHFAWQHDAQMQGKNKVSLFDDEAAPVEGNQSRGLLLSLNFQKHKATLVHQYLLRNPQHAGSQGSVQLLADGNVFVGWGQLPYYSEYNAKGKLLLQGKLPSSDESYRALKAKWLGRPLSSPQLKVRNGEAYVSWNGATQVRYWHLLVGPSVDKLHIAGGRVVKSGFETKFPISAQGTYYAVQAINGKGQILGTSKVFK